MKRKCIECVYLKHIRDAGKEIGLCAWMNTIQPTPERPAECWYFIPIPSQDERDMHDITIVKNRNEII